MTAQAVAANANPLAMQLVATLPPFRMDARSGESFPGTGPAAAGQGFWPQTGPKICQGVRRTSTQVGATQVGALQGLENVAATARGCGPRLRRWLQRLAGLCGTGLGWAVVSVWC
jgi:hypothetical protein